MNTKERTRHVRSEVNQANSELQKRHLWLRHQSVIGIVILMFSISGIIVSTFLESKISDNLLSVKPDIN